MSSDPLLDPVRNALNSVHAHFVVGQVPARRYPPEVAPFAVIDDSSAPTLARLQALMGPGDQVYIFGEPPARMKGLSAGPPLHTFQMLGPERPPAEDRDESCHSILMTSEDAGEMFELITLAFPGFFRKRTCEMGSYYGVRSGGELIAMGGERLALEGYSEISGVCTHPAHRGKGLAASLIWRLAQDHRRDGIVSFLHVAEENRRAIALYLRMGFKVVRKVTLIRISRDAAT